MSDLHVHGIDHLQHHRQKLLPDSRLGPHLQWGVHREEQHPMRQPWPRHQTDGMQPTQAMQPPPCSTQWLYRCQRSPRLRQEAHPCTTAHAHSERQLALDVRDGDVTQGGSPYHGHSAVGTPPSESPEPPKSLHPPQRQQCVPSLASSETYSTSRPIQWQRMALPQAPPEPGG